MRTRTLKIYRNSFASMGSTLLIVALAISLAGGDHKELGRPVILSSIPFWIGWIISSFKCSSRIDSDD